MNETETRTQPSQVNQEATMSWISSTIIGIVGVIIGAAGDRAFISIGKRKSQNQNQTAGSFSNQTQVGRDFTPGTSHDDK
jgi:hypothetical protein